MTQSIKSYLILGLVLLPFFVIAVHPAEQVTVEFLYWDPSRDPNYHYDPNCLPCRDAYYDFLGKSNVLYRIGKDYGDQILINYTQYYSLSGQEKRDRYKIDQFNSITIGNSIGNVTVIQGEFNEIYIRNVIDAYLGKVAIPPAPSPPLIAVLVAAFSFGLLEAFSPCLIALLSFALSYTVGETTRFKQSLLRVMIFAIGFVSAALLLGMAVGFAFFSFAPFYDILVWVICAFAVLFGLRLLGLDFLRFLRLDVKTKPLIGNLTRKYAFTLSGLFLLGFLFYFLDPCLAPIFVSALPIFLSEHIVFVLFAFGVGIMTPFVAVGILAGSVSKLARNAYRYKKGIRTVSGLILIGYAVYLILNYLV